MKLRMKRDAEGDVDISFEAEDDQEGRDLKDAVVAAGAGHGFHTEEILLRVIRELERMGYGEEDIDGQEGDVAFVIRREAEEPADMGRLSS